MFRGKNYKESAKLIDKQALYDPMEAFGLVIKASKAKFDETVELHVKLGVDGRHADQQVRGAIVLPNGTGKTVRVLVFCKDERKEEALAAGADYAGGMDLVEKIQKENWFEFDTVIASPDMMGTVGRLGKVLGPKCIPRPGISCSSTTRCPSPASAPVWRRASTVAARIVSRWRMVRSSTCRKTGWRKSMGRFAVVRRRRRVVSVNPG